ncbi:endolytic transglycosylase MltG [Sunxiuqinia dokdonensis]|uniref:Endolytic murein transglycosylase n=1 Tax=Sunxiuqinia dokdonensis TaxID=1409788 RepID=A0A0L8VD92_9BACT|nr:endolytic transglycosylase MltG [Sunxiuqinia dokdonensis]KOH46450.1 aminodeoxychorismate lyase [Sunxiuqinia dokdonensis]
MNLNANNRLHLFPKLNKWLIIFFAIAFIIAGLRGYQLFQYIFDENIDHPGSIIIAKDATYQDVLDSLNARDIIENEKAFRWVAKKKKYPASIKAGKYIFEKGMNTNQIVNRLRAGDQEPVTVTFNNLRFIDELAGSVAQRIEPDSLELLQYLNDSTVISQHGFDQHSFHAMFIPNTYEFYWTTTPEQFVERMASEYRRFWNDERLAKAESLGLTPIEVSTVASIVQEETIKADEKARVAGLYLNRIKRGMLLQADPTVKFALGDFGIKRVLNVHLKIDSPYNTYIYAGLPPGPINFPEISSIEAVLNAEEHAYLYMCASDEFNGYHNFAKTLREHNINARRYQEALNANKIWK